MDVLEDVLQQFHFSETLYCAHCTNRSPWGIRLAASNGVQFHAVRSGHCWVRAASMRLSLEPGDFVVLPQGDMHDVVDSPDTPATPARELLRDLPPTSRWMVSLGSDGSVSELICAGFRFSFGTPDPLLAFLPPLIHLRGAATESLEPLLVLAEREMRNAGRGTGAMLARIAEMLMVESVRTYVATRPAGETGWLAAIQDTRLASAIHAIHQDSSRAWTLHDLARQAGMSRTSLATKFRAVVGVSVQAYVTRVRMNRAASLLRKANRPSLARIAEQVGYSSEATFSRAFRREMGIAPGKLSRGRASTDRIGMPAASAAGGQAGFTPAK